MNTITKTVLLIGRPGSGKGTQAKMLSTTLGWKTLSSGDRFKEMRDGSGPLSERVKASYDAGQLLPDWFPAYLFEETVLNLEPDQGIVIEGFGRTRAQGQHLIDVLSWLNRDLTVLHLEVSEEVSLARMLERSKTEHRPDSDAEDKIRARFAEFNANTAPALEFFKEQGMLIEVNGEQSLEGVTKDILGALSV